MKEGAQEKVLNRPNLLVISEATAKRYFGDRLQDFNYWVSMGWQSFAGTAVIAFAVAGMAVVYQSLWSAYINPGRSLRDE